MTQDIIRMARESGIKSGDSYKLTVGHMSIETLERFAALAQAAERNKLAAWMIARGYATGHGDTMEDLLKELVWQVREREREAMLQLAILHGAPWHFQEVIRARGKHDE
jgi:hypothetical protein